MDKYLSKIDIVSFDNSNELHKAVLENEIVKEAIYELEKYDEITLEHSLRVAGYAMAIGKHYMCNDFDIIKLGISGLVHDIGKTRIPIELINKPSKLTKEEYCVVKQHVLQSAIWLSERNQDNEIILAVSQHHERSTGTGYPFGLRGNAITLFGRILIGVDAYDAITSRRSYHSPLSKEEAIKLIIESRGTDKNVLNYLNNI